MTTAFTAMPDKITMSAMRFLDGNMAEPYPSARAPSTDEDRMGRVFVELRDD